MKEQRRGIWEWYQIHARWKGWETEEWGLNHLDAQALRILRLLRILFGVFFLNCSYENTLYSITLPHFCKISKNSLNIDRGECCQLLILMLYFWTLKRKPSEQLKGFFSFFFVVALSQELRIGTMHPKQYFCVYVNLVLLSTVHWLFLWVSVALLKYVDLRNFLDHSSTLFKSLPFLKSRKYCLLMKCKCSNEM